MMAGDDIGDLTPDQLRDLARGMGRDDPRYETVRAELRSIGVGEKEAFASHPQQVIQLPEQRVVITDIRLSLGTVMDLMLKATFASIPIAIVFAIVLALLRGAF